MSEPTKSRGEIYQMTGRVSIALTELSKVAHKAENRAEAAEVTLRKVHDAADNMDSYEAQIIYNILEADTCWQTLFGNLI